MNAAKYIRYILTIATALLFFSACKDDKNESQPTDFILRVDESQLLVYHFGKLLSNGLYYRLHAPNRIMDIRLDRQNGRNGRTPSELRARHGYNRLSDRQIDTLLWIYLCRNRETFTIFCTRRFFPKRDFEQWNHGYP